MKDAISEAKTNSITIMKFRLLLLLGLSFLLTSCDKDEDPGGGSGDSKYFFEVKFDGATFRAEGEDVAWADLDGGTGNKLAIYGTDAPTAPGARRVWIVLPEKQGVGTYDMAVGGDAIASFLKEGKVFSSGLVNGSGTLEITEQTADNVKGTFSFVGIGTDGGATKDFTEGKFNVKLK